MTRSPTAAHFAKLRQDHRQLLLRCIACNRKRRNRHHALCHTDAALDKTDCESVETTVRKRMIRFARFVARMSNGRFLKLLMLAMWTGKMTTRKGKKMIG